MNQNDTISRANADFIENRVHMMLDIMENLPETIRTAPIAVYGYGFKSPSDAMWRLYLERDFAGMRSIVNKIRKTATADGNREDNMRVSYCCRILDRYLDEAEHVALTPVALRLYAAIEASRSDSLLTLQLYDASLVVDSKEPADAADRIKAVLRLYSPANGQESCLPDQLRENLKTCVEMLRGFTGSGHKNPNIKGETHHDKHAHAQSAPRRPGRSKQTERRAEKNHRRVQQPARDT